MTGAARGVRVRRAVAWGLLAADVLGAVSITVVAVLHTTRSATVPSTAAPSFMAMSFADAMP